MRRIELVPKITPDLAQALWYELEGECDGARGRPAVELDGAGVRHLSAAALQVLIVARRKAQGEGGAIRIVNASAEMRDCIERMGARGLFEEAFA